VAHMWHYGPAKKLVEWQFKSPLPSHRMSIPHFAEVMAKCLQ